jgi:hypothetical protein
MRDANDFVYEERNPKSAKEIKLINCTFKFIRGKSLLQ